MVFHKCVRVAPAVARRLAVVSNPWPAQSTRTLFSPWPRSSAIGALLRDMDRLEQRVFRDDWLLRPSAFLPIEDTSASAADASHFRVSVDLAGFKPEEIKLALDDAGRQLTVSARCERRGADGSRSTREMTRVIALPEAVDTTQMTSLLHRDGVLAVEAPFKELQQQQQLQQEPQSIPISRTGQQDSSPQQEKTDVAPSSSS